MCENIYQILDQTNKPKHFEFWVLLNGSWRANQLEFQVGQKRSEAVVIPGNKKRPGSPRKKTTDTVVPVPLGPLGFPMNAPCIYHYLLPHHGSGWPEKLQSSLICTAESIRCPPKLCRPLKLGRLVVSKGLSQCESLTAIPVKTSHSIHNIHNNIKSFTPKKVSFTMEHWLFSSAKWLLLLPHPFPVSTEWHRSSHVPIPTTAWKWRKSTGKWWFDSKIP